MRLAISGIICRKRPPQIVIRPLRQVLILACQNCDLTLIFSMGLRFPAQIHGQCFFVTTTFRDWQPFGNVAGMYEELAKSLAFCMNKYGALILGYVFMPSHIHLLINIDGRQLGSFMRDFKKYMAQKAANELGIESHNIWMPRYDRLAIVTENVLRTKLNYIHNNPIKAELVSAPEDWFWSSARV